MTRVTRPVIIIALLAITACSGNESPLPLVGTLERDRLELIADAQERIVELSVTEGATVVAGDVLLRLDSELAVASIARAQASRDRAEQVLAEKIRGPRQENILEAKARYAGAVKHFDVQSREYDRVLALVEARLQSAAMLDTAFDAREAAEAQRDEAEAQLAELIEGTTKEELAQARASLAEADAALAQQIMIAERLIVRAPRDGIVEAIPYKFGERPPPGATVIVMLAAETSYARVYVPEPLRARVSPGMSAEITVDGVDGRFAGRVRYVGLDAAFTPYFALTQRDRSRLAFLAEVTLVDEAGDALPAGIPVEVDFPELR